jgi:hypothetical protein
MSPSWTRLIRFVPADSPSQVLYGEPVGDSFDDIGLLAERGELQAKLVETDASGPLSDKAVVTDRVVKVGKLLGPLDQTSCTDIKCIGLNYKKHSEPRPTASLITM